MNIVKFKPSLNSQCLCGSGHKYKRCCFDEANKSGVDKQKLARKQIRKGEYRKGLTYIRQAITEYTILHKKNTAPYISSENKGVLGLLDLDIKALSELVSTMLDCCRGLDDYELFLETLERLRQNINTPRWQRKITYFQVIGRLGDGWHESVGKREIKKLTPLDNESDPEIIQLYLHFCADEISFKKNIDLTDKLISLVKSSSELFQYRVVKGVSYLSIGDEVEAVSIIESAIKEYDSKTTGKDNSYGKYIRARALNMLGSIKSSSELKQNALNEFKELLSENDWTQEGIANLYFEIGDCCFRLGRFQEAIDCYKSSLNKRDVELTKVFLAQAMGDNQDEESVTIIKNIDASKLDSSGRLDLIFNYARIGIDFKNVEMIKDSIQMLKSINHLDQIFEQHRSQLLYQINEVLIHGFNETLSYKIVSALKGMSRTVSRYFIIQPNIAGLGINVNNILEDIKKEPNSKDGS